MKRTVRETQWLLAGSAAASASPAEIGGKAYNLARLASADVAVPPWLVIRTDAFRSVVIDRIGLPADLEALDSWQEQVRNTVLSDDFLSGLNDALGRADLMGRLLAVRSSAASEDGIAASFAGQFDTMLGVRQSSLPDAIRSVWASAGNAHALAYGGGIAQMGVIIQAMLDPTVSGVAFGADPVSGHRDTVVVNAVFGLGEGLVSGDLDADTYRVRFDGGEVEVSARIAPKRERFRLSSGGGTEREPLPPGNDPLERTLSSEQVLRIADTVRTLGLETGGPQDVEWAIEDGNLFILQTRPITTLTAAAEGERRIWDNSNIVESYSGITSPLTFSFARSVYEDVYQQFCAVLGVPDPLIRSHRHVFANMLGLVRGRVYYNLLNWYRTLALLPGYAVNREFMERMMGVRQKLQNPPTLEATTGRGADSVRLVRMIARMIRESRALRTAVPAFHERIDRSLLPLAQESLTTWHPDRLLVLYRRLEEELLKNWQTPLVNDFFAMIWFGVLGRLVEKWMPDAPATLVNDLLTHEGGIISTEPARLTLRLSEIARADPAALSHFEAEADGTELARRIFADPACQSFSAEIQQYLARFGDRCMNELKLETITLAEDPSFLFQTIRGYLQEDLQAERAPTTSPRTEAEERVRAELSGWRRRLFLTVLAQTRARVRDRENLRFERTRVFGTVRRIFIGIGEGMASAGAIEAARDVFFLRVEEIFGWVEGTGAGHDLRALIEARKKEWEEYARTPPPPDRFESLGPVARGNWIVPEPPVQSRNGDLHGIGCCPGVIRAPVRIVRDPRDAGDLSGHILVAERTDPGWTLLFPVARGLLVERGSLLSHSAIVAREVGLPCIVSIAGLLATLRDGEVVEMDGTAGTIRRIDG
jgi:rifampicin phosphotransferase